MMSEHNPLKNPEHSEVQLNRWLEKRRIFDAVAVYGTHLGVLDILLSTGKVTPFPAERAKLPYQQEILSEHKYLYYALPFLNKIRKVKPELEKSLLERYFGDPAHIKQTFFSRNYMLGTAQVYAMDQAIKATFTSKLGVSISEIDIFQLAIELIPEEFDEFHNTSDVTKFSSNLGFIEADSNPEILSAIKAKHSEEQIITALRASLHSNFVLLFFNESIFDSHTVKRGYETDHELLIMGNQLLNSKAIAGVQIVSAGQTK